jgi:hypothetical protein
MFWIGFLIISALNIDAFDTPNDDGSSITITWPADTGLTALEVLRNTQSSGEFEKIGDATMRDSIFQDADARRGVDYYYRLKWNGPNGEMTSNVAGPVRAQVQWLNLFRLQNIGFLIAILFAVIIFYINHARSGKKLFIRRIPGLNAVDDAIGRATEMGKPVLYVPGINDIDDPQTIASMSILSRVAEKTAEYGTTLFVPTCHAMTMTMAQQVVKESAIRVGRPDWYNVDNIRYMTDDQFGYVSAVDGIMIRDRPATNFYLGTFYAESLILSETGHSTGAIQIAGTAMSDQLPFFVAACDYTLLGEELYAASAYLSQEPVQLGSLKGQDLGKLIFIALILAGVITRFFGWNFFYNLFTVQQ